MVDGKKSGYFMKMILFQGGPVNAPSVQSMQFLAEILSNRFYAPLPGNHGAANAERLGDARDPAISRSKISLVFI